MANANELVLGLGAQALTLGMRGMIWICKHAVHTRTFGYIMKNILLMFFLGFNDITIC